MGRVEQTTGREMHPSTEELKAAPRRMRALDLVSIHAAGSGHPGGTLSIMDVAAVLFLDETRYDPRDPQLGRAGSDLLLCGAQGTGALCRAWSQAGFYSEEQAVTLRKLGSPFQGHPHAPAPAGARGLQRIPRPGPGDCRRLRSCRPHGRQAATASTA